MAVLNISWEMVMLILWWMLLNEAALQLQTCPPVEPGAGEEIISTKPLGMHPPDSLLYYKCKRGYKQVNGEKLLRCTKTLRWETLRSGLKCEAICQPPPKPSTGEEITYTQRVHIPGSLLHYRCKRGYRHVEGEKLLNCTTTLIWETVYSDLKCQVSAPLKWNSPCGRLPYPCNGQKLINPKGIYKAGDVACYGCSEGYRYVRGNTTFLCAPTLMWERPAYDLECEAQKCPSPPQPGIGEEIIPAKNVHTPGSLLYYRCKPGYKHIDGEKLLNCSSTLDWQPVYSDLKCALQCESPPEPGIGEMIRPMRIRRLYTPGSLLRYKCKPGYSHVEGEKLLNCTLTLSWETLKSDLKCEEPKLKIEGGCDPTGCGAQIDQHIEHETMNGSQVDQSSVAVDQSSVVVDQSSVAVHQSSVAVHQSSVASRSQSCTAFALLEVGLVVAMYICRYSLSK